MSDKKKNRNGEIDSPRYVDLICQHIQTLPEPAHVKEVNSGAYISSNPSNLLVYGLTKVEDLVGKNIGDMDVFMKPFWGGDFSQTIRERDHWVKTKECILINKGVTFLDKDGLVHVQCMVKEPVKEKDGKINYIFTHSHEQTNNIDLLRLFAKYQEIYKKTSDACKYFCQYLNILKFFTAPPSIEEIKVLLHSRDSRIKKNIAHQMDVSIHSIKTYICRINLKLKTLDFKTLVELIRAFNGAHKNFTTSSSLLCD